MYYNIIVHIDNQYHLTDKLDNIYNNRVTFNIFSSDVLINK